MKIVDSQRIETRRIKRKLGSVMIEVDKGGMYEARRWPYWLSLPLMWSLTVWVGVKKTVARLFKTKIQTNTLWFDGLSQSCRKIKEGAGTCRALDIIYNYEFGTDGIVGDFWIGMMNAQAVRNRLKLVSRELLQAVRGFKERGEVRLISIAAGSAQAVLETMEQARAEGITTKAIVLDLDPVAIEYSRRIARQKGLTENLVFVNKGINKLEKVCGDFHPHIVEMVGFMDYRPYRKAVKLVERIRNLLEPAGVFLACNIRWNPEAPFLWFVIDWPLIYRRPKTLAKIIVKGGFAPHNTKIIYEPHKVHGVVITKKA